MSARMPRYKFSEKSTKKSKMSFEKKTVLQSLASIMVLTSAFFVCRFDFPYSKNFKNYIKRSLNVSTDVKEVKNFASYAIKKSGLDNIDFIKNIDDKLNENKENGESVLNESNALAAPEENFSKEEIKSEAPSEAPSEVPSENTMPAFRNPTEGKISSVFGERIHPVTGESGNVHTGIDIAGVLNQTVISAAKGRVVKTGEDDANGKYIVIEHTGGYTTAYAHLNQICVVDGEWVDDNTKIGLMGSSGVSTGVHLHFEIKKDGERLNPEDFVLYKHK